MLVDAPRSCHQSARWEVLPSQGDVRIKALQERVLSKYLDDAIPCDEED